MARLTVALVGSLLLASSVLSAQVPKEIPKQLLRAAERGSAPAQYAVGAWYQHNGDLQSAAIWYLQSAQRGYVGAQFKLAELLEHGFADEAADIEAATRWYKEAAVRGFEPAIAKLEQLSPSALAEKSKDVAEPSFSPVPDVAAERDPSPPTPLAEFETTVERPLLESDVQGDQLAQSTEFQATPSGYQPATGYPVGDGSGAGAILLIVLGLVAWVVIAAVRNAAGNEPHSPRRPHRPGGAQAGSSTNGSTVGDYSGSDEYASASSGGYTSGQSSANRTASPQEKGSWFSDMFEGRTSSKPEQGWFERHGDFRDRVYKEGKERIIEDLTGSRPSQGLFEGDDAYRSRIAHEANERIVHTATENKPSQGLFESDDSYRERVHHEANERIVEGATGSAPRQGIFESDDAYHDRVTHESNERIVESATGSKPSQGFFESDDDYQTRISQEAKDAKASQND